MVHWAGQRVAADAGIPFVMDLRDPWSLVERLADSFASPVWFHLARRFEREAVAGASLIVMNTEPARRAMGQAYPRLSDRIMTVMNGYDEDRPGCRARPIGTVCSWSSQVRSTSIVTRGSCCARRHGSFGS